MHEAFFDLEVPNVCALESSTEARLDVIVVKRGHNWNLFLSCSFD